MSSEFIPAPERGMHFEFLCQCGETYVGEDGNDNIHGESIVTGKECGKEAILMGWWKIPRKAIRKNARRPKHL
jgi:hypothetical protein